MVNIVLIRVEIVHKLKGVLINFHFVPFLSFIGSFQIFFFDTVWFKGVDKVALMPAEGNLGQELAKPLCLNH